MTYPQALEPELSAETVDLVELIHVPEWKSILVELVKSEKMDPWNIDLIGLANQYAAKIASLTETNLRIPANAILALSILLKFKSKKLRISSIEELDELQTELSALSPAEKRLFESMVPELQNPRALREGGVSLDSLVEAIEELISKSKRKSLLGHSSPFSALPAFSLENIEEKLDGVFQKIRQNADGEGLALFSQLLNGDRSPTAVLDVFIPVLFLANQQKVSAWQDDWMGEIFISLNGAQPPN